MYVISVNVTIADERETFVQILVTWEDRQVKLQKI
jgi:hypothetical protein